MNPPLPVAVALNVLLGMLWLGMIYSLLLDKRNMKMIKPTIGRVVLVRPFGVDGPTWPGLICHVWSDRCINVAGFDSNGDPFKMGSIVLLQAGDVAASDSPLCEWMPYQIGQAKKYETPGAVGGS